jgi:DNA polymerase III sliding clamp (beta) subunit (PCNA family)
VKGEKEEMNEKNSYYVSLQSGEIRHQPWDDQLNYFEIKADVQEVKTLEQLLREVNKRDFNSNAFLYHHFNESKVDGDREEYQSILEKTYQKIYNLGTEETKRQLKAL